MWENEKKTAIIIKFDFFKEWEKRNVYWAHKCNIKGCNDLVVFEHADFDLQNSDIFKGVYTFDDPNCNVCRKEFLVVPSNSVIDFNEEI